MTVIRFSDELAAVFAVLWLVAAAPTACAGDMLLTMGGGPQPGADQRNATWGLDYSFHRFQRSSRQHIEVGVSYTSLRTNASASERLYAVSIYPQLTLYPSPASKFATHFPSWAEPFFFVRALGPSYLSSSRLGERRQAKQFTFQAQVGVGVILQSRGILGISWKHFSNANLFSQNDGIDVPLVFNAGVRF
jgi:hypothetical protein